MKSKYYYASTPGWIIRVDPGDSEHYSIVMSNGHETRGRVKLCPELLGVVVVGEGEQNGTDHY